MNESVEGYPGWTIEKCSCHAGTVANAYGEPTDCRDCNGGVVFVSPKGAYAMYPGGPFLGRRGGKWQKDGA